MHRRIKVLCSGVAPEWQQAGELIPELARHGLQQLIMLELAGTSTQLMIKVGEECQVLLAKRDQVKEIS